jgi:hypothetical protein
MSAFLLASGVLIAPGLSVALAGPCSDQIAELSRVTSGGASPATTGSTASPGAGTATADGRSGTAAMSAAAGQAATSPEDVRRQQEGRPTTAQATSQALPATTGSTPPGAATATADGRGGTAAMSAAAGQAATSPEDVRRQQEGRPTTAQAANQASDRIPLAKAKLDQARALDEQGNAGCTALVNEARAALEGK